MSRIIGEAMIFTMGYVLKNIEDENEGKVTVNLDDVPEFKNITIDNIKCNNSKVALKVDGLKELPIHDIYIKNSQINAKKGLDLKMCKNIVLSNTTIKIANKEEYCENEKFDA